MNNEKLISQIVKFAQKNKPRMMKISSIEYDIGHLKINDNEFDTLLATTIRQQEHGLMGVLPPAPVMSFLYDRPQINRFWMKSTIAPLDIVFVLGGRITGIYKGEPYSTAAIGDPYSPSDLVVELPEGTCKYLGIEIGNTAKVSR